MVSHSTPVASGVYDAAALSSTSRTLVCFITPRSRTMHQVLENVFDAESGIQVAHWGSTPYDLAVEARGIEEGVRQSLVCEDVSPEALVVIMATKLRRGNDQLADIAAGTAAD